MSSAIFIFAVGMFAVLFSFLCIYLRWEFLSKGLFKAGSLIILLALVMAIADTLIYLLDKLLKWYAS